MYWLQNAYYHIRHRHFESAPILFSVIQFNSYSTPYSRKFEVNHLSYFTIIVLTRPT